MLFKIMATLIHHTTNRLGISVDEKYDIPEFLLSSKDHNIRTEEEACQIAHKIICPVELQYESISVIITATVLR